MSDKYKFGPDDSYLRHVSASAPPPRMTPVGPYQPNPLSLTHLEALHAQDVADELRAEARR
jgi:hypothetical protein